MRGSYKSRLSASLATLTSKAAAADDDDDDDDGAAEAEACWRSV